MAFAELSVLEHFLEATNFPLRQRLPTENFKFDGFSTFQTDEKICEWCNEPYSGTRMRKRKFCSVRCSTSHRIASKPRQTQEEHRRKLRDWYRKNLKACKEKQRKWYHDNGGKLVRHAYYLRTRKVEVGGQ